MKMPLAFLQLTHEKTRLLIALAGIGFADILMFMQLGFKNALFDSSVRLHKSLEGDIFILNSSSDTFTNLKSVSQRRLYDILSVNTVQSVTPMYLGIGSWKNPLTGKERAVFTLGVNPEKNVVNLPGVAENIAAVKQQDTVLFDQGSRAEFGPIAELFNSGQEVKTEVSKRRLKIGGLFTLGTSFGADGTIITSDVNFWRLFPERERGLIDLGIIQLKPNTDVETTLAFLRKNMSSKDIKFYSKEELIQHEKSFWQNRTAIGFIFSLGTMMGFVVGTIIVYQILYT
ncbi:MAG TPA: ABC transporter, partial [Cyanothece sp. UBA12306]|nr:ABC transporter [Cyanothece sp. UBA12306]